MFRCSDEFTTIHDLRNCDDISEYMLIQFWGAPSPFQSSYAFFSLQVPCEHFHECIGFSLLIQRYVPLTWLVCPLRTFPWMYWVFSNNPTACTKDFPGFLSLHFRVPRNSLNMILQVCPSKWAWSTVWHFDTNKCPNIFVSKMISDETYIFVSKKLIWMNFRK